MALLDALSATGWPCYITSCLSWCGVVGYVASETIHNSCCVHTDLQCGRLVVVQLYPSKPNLSV